MSRSSEIRSFVHRMSKIHGCAMETDYYDYKRNWEIRWHDGPTAATVLADVARRLPDHREVIYAARDFSEEAIVLSAIRLFASGEAGQWTDLRYAAIRSLEDVEFPLGTATAREGAMVERALEESAQNTRWGRERDADYALKLLKERRGIGWLLAPPTEDRQPETDAPPLVPAVTPIELLTSRYARGDHGAAWLERAEAMPLAEAFAAVFADPEPDQDSSLAALALVAQLRAELDGQEAALIHRARGAGASWTDVGQVLGMTKQSAHKRYTTLTTRSAPTSADS